jgi:hypothetical protein
VNATHSATVITAPQGDWVLTTTAITHGNQFVTVSHQHSIYRTLGWRVSARVASGTGRVFGFLRPCRWFPAFCGQSNCPFLTPAVNAAH